MDTEKTNKWNRCSTKVTEESENIEEYLRFIHFEYPFTFQKLQTLVYSFWKLSNLVL